VLYPIESELWERRDVECLCGMVGTFVRTKLDLWGWLLLRELKSERGAVWVF
jgi:hypothetical protein